MVSGTVGNTASLEASVPFTASYLNGRATFWGRLNSIFAYSTAWTYCKVVKRNSNGRKGYLDLYDHFLIPNNVDNMESAAENIL